MVVKLIRDKIPKLIQNEGYDYPHRRVMEDPVSAEDYSVLLREKILEESIEVLRARGRADTIEELADMLEVIYAIAADMDVSFGEIQEARAEKKITKGGFGLRRAMQIDLDSEEDEHD